jgi:Fe-S cluster assembly iron-binding protein IscA
MLKLSDGAVEALRDTGALRFAAQETGDGELEIDVRPAAGPEEGDSVVEKGDVRVYLDAIAAEALADQVLEVEPHGDHVHFAFSPQAV